jgi:hypothetical protein
MRKHPTGYVHKRLMLRSNGNAQRRTPRVHFVVLFRKSYNRKTIHQLTQGVYSCACPRLGGGPRKEASDALCRACLDLSSRVQDRPQIAYLYDMGMVIPNNEGFV